MARTRLIGLPYAGEGKELKAAVGPWGRGGAGAHPPNSFLLPPPHKEKEEEQRVVDNLGW